MPDATPRAPATASASSTISSWLSSRSPTACSVTLHSKSVLPHPGERVGELLEARQVVPGEQLVDVRRGHHHPERGGHEVGGVTLVRIEPDDAVAEPGEPVHRLLEDMGIAAVETVGADHHDAAP